MNHHHLLRFAPRNATADLVELRASFCGIAGRRFDRVGSSRALRGGSCDYLCRSVCDGELSVRRVCVGGVGAGGSPKEGAARDAVRDSSSIPRDAGTVCHCDGCLAQVSALGLWHSAMYLVCSSEARSLWRAFVNLDSFVTPSYRDSSISTMHPNQRGVSDDCVKLY